MTKKNAGYTLIELMIVLAMMGVLMTIAVPKLMAMVHRSKEGATKTNLANIRSALQVFYADNEGVYPTDSLTSLTANSKYLNNVPVTNIYNTYHHPASTKVSVITLESPLPTDTGGWAYVADRRDPRWGMVFINCSHPDLYGQPWSQF